MSNPKLLVADDEGNIIEHPYLEMAGGSAERWDAMDASELVALPEGTKVFYLPGSMAVGWDPAKQETVVEPKYQAVAAMLQAGYTRTRIPAAAYPPDGPGKYGCHDYLPLWAYAAVGWQGDDMVAAAFRVDPMTHSETRHYDDRHIAPRVEKRLRKTRNRLIHHLSRCALEYHCFAAKNFFMDRWEAPLPTAPACNAACVGCISLQPSDCCPSSQDRISFVPTVEELAEVAVVHLDKVERGIVSFGQGCEGEPLLSGERIADAVKEFRRHTANGTIHLNTNGSLPEMLRRIIGAGLDSVRISLNSLVEQTYNAYYRPRSYKLSDVEESIKAATGEGVYTSLNLLVFPGINDLPEEMDRLFETIRSTGLNMVHLRNLSIDPRLYMDNLPASYKSRNDALGLRNMALRLKTEFPNLDLGYFNRPKEDFGAPLTSLEFLTAV